MIATETTRRHIVTQLNWPKQLAVCSLALLCPSAALSQKGWPRGGAGGDDAIQASPLLVDLENDGKLEIVVAGFDDKLYVYNHDGTPRSGFPVTLGFGDGSIASVTSANLLGDGVKKLVILGDNTASKSASIKYVSASGGTVNTIALSNVTSASGKGTVCAVNCRKYLSGSLDPAEELVVRDGLGQIHIVHRLAGGNFSDLYASGGNFDTVSSQQLQDLSGSQPINASMSAQALPSGNTLLLAPSTDGKIYYWEVTSNSTTNWSLSTKASIDTGDATRFYASATITDLDGNGGVDIVAAATNGKVYVWDYLNGKSPRAPWPVATGKAIFSSPAIADVDQDENDSSKEIVVGSDSGEIFAWHSDGSALSGWPVWTKGAVFASPALADVDPSAGVEIIVGGTDGSIYAWTVNGDPLRGWPKLLGVPIYASPAVGDIHESLKFSIIIAAFDGRVFCFDMNDRYDATLPGWFQFRGGPSRRGTNQ